MKLDIRLDGDPVLRKKAEPVKKIDDTIKRLIADMFETMYHANGAGLAAPQIGVSKRLIVIDVGDGPVVLVNPSIVAGSGEAVDSEGCLSIPGIAANVKRFETVIVEGSNALGKTVKLAAEGLFARALQHEIDHLDGVLITDKAINIVK